MTDKEKFRKEVEKLKSNLIHGACSSQIAMETRCKEEAYNEVLAILDSSQEETVSENLEEACEQLAENARKHKAETSSPFFSQTDYKQGVIDGAKWQKQQDQSTIELAEDHAYFAGMEKIKEEMMAKTKSGTVQKDNQVILDDGAYIDLDPSMQLKPSFVGLKEGDRIKVIVIKEN